MKSGRERQNSSYPSRSKGNKGNSGRNNHAGVSLGFCWGFGLVVCLTFGLASFLMFSAGHFNFSPDTGVTAAWGDNAEENLITGSLITVEVTELEAKLKDPIERESQYLLARNNGNVIEEFGPLPKYLSDYESIQLTRDNDGTKLPEDAEEDDDIPINHEPDIHVEQPVLEETGPFWREHFVKSGETLSDIAKEYGNITAQDILRANGLKDANRLSENQLLLIPVDSDKIEDTLDEVRTRQMRVAATKEVVEPLKVKSYVVAQGDSLWSIANSQNIELDTLVGSNTFKTSARLRPGAILRIPNQDGIFYVMKKAETIEAVCKRYGVSLNKVRNVNPEVNVAKLKADDEIFLPGARPEGLIEHHDNNTRVAEVRRTTTTTTIPAPKKTAPARERTPLRVEKIERPAKGEVAVRKAGGGFRWPIMGRINSPFGWRQHPITRRRDFHTGIDIKADRNDPIKAAGSGRVVYSGWMGGYGKVLVIEHPNGQSTLYAHCSTLLAGKGATVSQNQIVAKIGTTGRSTGPHLHFEVRNGNSPVNPIKYLGR